MKKAVALIMITVLLATPGLGLSAITTANVNFRAGPGAQHESYGVLPAGSEVALGECDASGNWCSVKLGDDDGFISGRYLHMTGNEADDAEDSWPRAYKIGDSDAFLVLYQPQFTAWQDFRRLEALVAAEYRASETASPVFGVVGLAGKTAQDADNDTILLSDIEVTQLDFGALGREQLAALMLEVGELLPTDSVAVAEERVTASLAAYQQVSDVDGLKADPPLIFTSTEPARLVQTDGEAVLAPVKGATGVTFVVNTNWDLLQVDERYYLRDDESWQVSAALDSGWSALDTLPDALTDLPDDGNWDDARATIPAKPYPQGAPRIHYAAAPAELILFDGEPALEDVPGTTLAWASNTEADVFTDKQTGLWYFLVSGRWFRAKSLDGPWEFATPELPDAFRDIPDDAPYYTVRASVPGTSEANEARLRASIPEMAQVELGAVTASVAYDGEPAFEPIEGTTLQSAVNTSSQVIAVGGRYYVVQDGIWFVADSPQGPWTVATSVPDEVYTIPPSSQHHNVTYVRVYESDSDTVTYGYTTGYLWGLLAWGALVYGSGWVYRPYWGYGGHTAYYARPLTYGTAAYYNPARGFYGRYGHAYGPYRGISARAVYNPRTGTYARGARVQGPYGSRGFVAAYNPRTGTGAVARGGSSVYGSWGAAGVRRGSDYARTRGGSTAGGAKGVRWDTSRGTGAAVSGRRGNVYAGRDGNVYRNAGDGWQKWGGGDWNSVDRPSPAQFDRSGAEDFRQRLDAASGGELAGRLGGAEGPLGERPGGAGGQLEALGAAGAGAAGALAADRAAAADRQRRIDRDSRTLRDRAQAHQPSHRTEAARERPRVEHRSRPTRPAEPAQHHRREQRPRSQSNVHSHLQRDRRGRELGNTRSLQHRQANRGSRGGARGRRR